MLNFMYIYIKIVVVRGFAPDPIGGAYYALPDPLIGGARVLRTLGLTRFARSACALSDRLFKKNWLSPLHHFFLVAPLVLAAELGFLANNCRART